MNIYSATATDGIRLAYARHTPASRRNDTPRVAMLHSLAMDHTFWNPVIAELPDDIDIIAIDARGHGASEKPAGPYTVDLFADDLAAIFDHAGWESACVAGASMGGSVSTAFGGRHAHRTDGLVLVDTTAWYGENAEVPWEERGQKAMSGGMEALIQFQTSRWFSPGFLEERPDIVKDSVDVFLRNDTSAYLETCRMLGRCDTREVLAGFDFPVAVGVGEDDYATPIAMAQVLESSIPEASLTIIKETRHYTPLERPDRIAALITDVISRRA